MLMWVFGIHKVCDKFDAHVVKATCSPATLDSSVDFRGTESLVPAAIASILTHGADLAFRIDPVVVTCL